MATEKFNLFIRAIVTQFTIARLTLIVLFTQTSFTAIGNESKKNERLQSLIVRPFHCASIEYYPQNDLHKPEVNTIVLSLLPLLEKDDPQTRILVIDLLTGVQHPDIADALRKLQHCDKNQDVRTKAKEALQLLGQHNIVLPCK